MSAARLSRSRLAAYLGPRFAGDPLGDAVQPTAHRGLLANGSGSPRQYKKGRLESVLRGMGVAGDALTDAQHHRAVPLHEDFKRGLFALLRKRSSKAPSLSSGPSWTADARRRKRTRSVRIPCGMDCVSRRRLP